jgi:pyruvate dehydrogenase E2 component (dihydrolipoamide acetyltransferase)
VTTDLILPKFNMDMETAVLVRWLHDDGDRVEEGDPVAEIETDKVNMEVEATAGGILCGLRFAPGDVVPVTVPIASIAPDEAAAEAVRASIGAQPTEPEATQAQAGEGPTADAARSPATANEPAAKEAGMAEGAAGQTSSRPRATPAIRRLAREHGIDLAQVADADGRVTTAALQSAIERRTDASAPVSEVPAAAAHAPAVRAPAAQAHASQAPAPSVPIPGETARPAGTTRTPLDATRRAIAERMTTASRVPQITLTVEVRAGSLVRLRDESVARPSFSAIFAIAAARAIRDHPLVNSTFEDGVVITHAAVDLGIAVARPAGLIVPVLRDADRLTVLEADARIRDLVARARAGQLRLDEVSGGSFTITSLGEAGVDNFTPLLNPPQVAILAIGRLAPRVVPIENGIAVEPTVGLSLACDHRVIDGAPGAEFLATLRRLLEAPAWLASSLEVGQASGS